MGNSSSAVRKGVLGPVGALLLLTLTTIIAPVPAQAEDNFSSVCSRSDIYCDEGVKVSYSWPSSDKCQFWGDFTDNDVHVCVRTSTDQIFVRDVGADSNAVVARHRLRSESGLVRYCVNRFGYGTWAMCDFNWPEDRWWNIYGGEYNYRSNTFYWTYMEAVLQFYD